MPRSCLKFSTVIYCLARETCHLLRAFFILSAKLFICSKTVSFYKIQVVGPISLRSLVLESTFTESVALRENKRLKECRFQLLVHKVTVPPKCPPRSFLTYFHGLSTPCTMYSVHTKLRVCRLRSRFF